MSIDTLALLRESQAQESELKKQIGGLERLLKIEKDQHAETRRDRDKYAGEVCRLQRQLHPVHVVHAGEPVEWDEWRHILG